jgi:hypothetical protein
MDITTHPIFMELSQETKNKILEDFSASGITDLSGKGNTENIKRQIWVLENTPELLDSYLQVEINSIHEAVLKANGALKKEIQKPDADPRRVSKLQSELDAANQRYTSLVENRKMYLEAMGWKGKIDVVVGKIRRLQSKGNLGQIPESIKEEIMLAFKEEDLERVHELLIQWACLGVVLPHKM